MPAQVTDYTDVFKIIEILVGTITFLVVISYVFKETAGYRIMSHIVLGAATAVAIMVTWRDVVHPNWWLPVTKGATALSHGSWDWNILWVLCLVPGLMWYTLYFKKLEWMSRIVFGLFIGMGAGLAFKNYLLLIVPQITQSFKPLVAVRDGAFDWGATIKNLLFMATLVGVLVYFFFTFRKEVALVTPARAYGRWMMMICFGTLFGYTVMTRMSYFLERLNYVKTELIEGVFRAIF
jgi:hypothetical protein